MEHSVCLIREMTFWKIPVWTCFFWGGALRDSEGEKSFFHVCVNERAGLNDLKVCSCYAIKWC